MVVREWWVRPFFLSVVVLSALLALPSITPASPLPPPPSGWRVPGEVVLGLHGGALAPAVAERLAGQYGGTWQAAPWAQAFVVRVPEGTEDVAAESFRRHPAVAYAEPNVVLRLLREPNDTFYRSQQWNLSRIRMPEAWDISLGQSAPFVAVIDSGADATHPDLAGKLLPGWNAILDNFEVTDEEGHGTHITGMIAARTDNALGIAGVTWGGTVMPIKASRAGGVAQAVVVAAAVNWATDHGARIINLSLGGPFPSEVLRQAIVRARGRGVLVVAAAGNCGRDSDTCTERNQVEYPAAFPGVLAVAATTFDDRHASYSTEGSFVALSAPGGDATDPADGDPRHWIVGPAPRSVSASMYISLIGTSQAAPHVAGVAALVWGIAPRLSADEVAALLQDTAVDLGPAGRDPTFGAGRLDAAAALRAARIRAGVPTPTPTPPPPAPTPTPPPGPSPSSSSPFPWLVPTSYRVYLPTVRRTGSTLSSASVDWQAYLEAGALNGGR